MTLARGESSLREAEQDTREEDVNTEAGATATGLACHDQEQVSPVPFWTTPGPITEPSIKEITCEDNWASHGVPTRNHASTRVCYNGRQWDVPGSTI